MYRSGAKLFNTCMAERSSSSEDELSGFGATCVAGLAGHGGLRSGACVAGLSSCGVDFWATALSTYPTTKIAATDNDRIIVCGSAILTSTHCTASFDGGAESKAGHYLGNCKYFARPFTRAWPNWFLGSTPPAPRGWSMAPHVTGVCASWQPHHRPPWRSLNASPRWCWTSDRG